MANFFFRNQHTHSQTAYLCNSADQIFLVFNWLPFYSLFIITYFRFVQTYTNSIKFDFILFSAGGLSA